MIEITNLELFKSVVSGVIEKAVTNSATDDLAKRWTNAIDRAVTEIENNPFLSWDEAEESLLILSPRSNNIYAANGVCQCIAFQLQTPCWHRAAARIVRLYMEALSVPPVVVITPEPAPSIISDEQSKSVYIKTMQIDKNPTFIGGIRI